MIRTFAFRMSLLGSLLFLLAGCNSLQELLPDLTNPNVSLVSGATDGSTVNTNTVTFIVSATDDRSVAIVTVRVGSGTTVACTLTTTARYECTTPSLSLGTNTITVTATDGSGNSGTLLFTLTYERVPGTSDFDIEVRFDDSGFSESQKAAFLTAADVWRSVVIGDVADFPVDISADHCGVPHNAVSRTGSNAIDDLLIIATTYTPSDPNILGSAGPCLSRPDTVSDSTTTILGVMRFNSAKIDQLETDGQLVTTIVHEMGHVLGIGTNWESSFLGYDYLDYVATTAYGCNDHPTDPATFSENPTYTGPAGVAVWQGDLAGSGNVPVEENYGVGTQCGHWDEETFGAELMTGILNSGVANPLSALSVASLEDINYVVDTSAADSYSLPSSALVAPAGFDIGAVEELLRPVSTVDPITGKPVPFPGKR